MSDYHVTMVVQCIFRPLLFESVIYPCPKVVGSLSLGLRVSQLVNSVTCLRISLFRACQLAQAFWVFSVLLCDFTAN